MEFKATHTYKAIPINNKQSKIVRTNSLDERIEELGILPTESVSDYFKEIEETQKRYFESLNKHS